MARSAAPPPPIPDKLHFKIGEVAVLVGVRPHVLRFWESELPTVRPAKASNGHRIYSRADVERLRRIRVLLHTRRFTLAGVRALLVQGDAAVRAALEPTPSEAADRLRSMEEKIATLEKELAGLGGRLAEAEHAADAAREEAAFWRAQVCAVEARESDLTERVRRHATALREVADRS